MGSAFGDYLGFGDRPQGSLNGVRSPCIVRGCEENRVSPWEACGALCLHTPPLKMYLLQRRKLHKTRPHLSKLQKTTSLRARLAEITTLQFLGKKHQLSRKQFANTTDRRLGTDKWIYDRWGPFFADVALSAGRTAVRRC